MHKGGTLHIKLPAVGLGIGECAILIGYPTKSIELPQEPSSHTLVPAVANRPKCASIPVRIAQVGEKDKVYFELRVDGIRRESMLATSHMEIAQTYQPLIHDKVLSASNSM